MAHGPRKNEDEGPKRVSSSFKFIPSAQHVLGELVPSYVLTIIHQALIDSAAAEQGIIRLLYLDPGLFYGRTNVPDAAQFSSPELRHIYTVLLAHGGTGTVQIAALSGELTPDELALLTGIVASPSGPSSALHTGGAWLLMGSAPEGLRLHARKSSPCVAGRS